MLNFLNKTFHIAITFFLAFASFANSENFEGDPCFAPNFYQGNSYPVDDFQSDESPYFEDFQTNSSNIGTALASVGYLSYTSERGLGINSGYTTLGLFAAIKDDYFADFRFHLLDNGKYAFNIGGGARYLSNSYILGANIYYDYRETSYKNYHQLGLGLEFLGCSYDIRANAYIPLGSTRSSSDTCIYEYDGGYFALNRDFEYSFWGADLEFGVPISCKTCAGDIRYFYLAAGPYYLKSDHTSDFWGARFRLISYVNEYIRLEGRLTYDHVFKTRGQGVVTLEIPFEEIFSLFNCKSLCGGCSSCCFDPIFRNEIIPVQDHCRWECNYNCIIE